MGVGAALFSGSKCYFFDGKQYIRVTRGETGPGTVDAGYPAPVSKWGWPAGFGQFGLDAALYSGSKGTSSTARYIRVIERARQQRAGRPRARPGRREGTQRVLTHPARRPLRTCS
jgi:hypothetical protein